MIFELYFIGVMAGFSSTGQLLGSYMVYYTGASSLNLGFVFMLQPFTIFARPFICGHADRHQGHQRLLSLCLMLTSLAYVPFIIIPYCLESSSKFNEMITPETSFWLLACFHLIGSLGFCGIRSLGDALAVNYAKRVGSDYPMYRKYGAISFGLCAYGLGMINQDWLLPNFVPGIIVYVLSLFILSVLVFLWPREYFKMIPKGDAEESLNQLEKLPKGGQILVHMRRKLHHLVLRRDQTADSSKAQQMELEEAKRRGSEPETTSLTVKQQVAIFWLLLKRDYRIPLFLLLLAYIGAVGYAPQNFVFTYLNQRCQLPKCNGSTLGGIVMLSYCLVETISYLAINSLRKNLNFAMVLAVALFSLSIHYLFFGFALNQVSPYFFLVESLHGVEYATTLSASIELGYRFGNEVELLVPELLSKGTIRASNDLELVKLSLLATMSGCFTLVHDGVGTIVGAGLYGYLIKKWDYPVTFVLIGTMAAAGFFTIVLVLILSRLLYIEPKIKKLAREQQQPPKPLSQREGA